MQSTGLDPCSNGEIRSQCLKPRMKRAFYITSIHSSGPNDSSLKGTLSFTYLIVTMEGIFLFNFYLHIIGASLCGVERTVSSRVALIIGKMD